MELKNIDKITFDSFAINSNKPHFLQSSGWSMVSESRGSITHLLGLFDNDEIVGCALLIEKKILFYSSFYCPRGFIVDYSNYNLIKEMTLKLKEYVKKRNGLYFKIDPDLIIHKLNYEDASIKEENINNLELIEYLKSIGYKHRGFTTKFNESSMPRFTFRVDISSDIETIKSRMHSTTRKILNSDNPYHIEIRKNNFDDFKAFYKTMQDTAVRKSIYLEPFSFYETFYNNLYQNNMSDLYSAVINVKEVLSLYEKEIENSENKKIELLNNPNNKTANKIKEIDNHLNKMYKNLNELKNINEEELILSSIITAKHDNKVWLVHGGNRDILKFLNANYLLYYSIMLDAKNEGYEVCDFYGTEGKVDKHSELYGLYLFKCRFGGDLCEFIGEFDYITKPLINTIINRLLHIRRRMMIKNSVKKGKTNGTN